MAKKRVAFLVLSNREAVEIKKRINMTSMSIYGNIVPQATHTFKLEWIGKKAPGQVHIVDENTPRVFSVIKSDSREASK